MVEFFPNVPLYPLPEIYSGQTGWAHFWNSIPFALPPLLTVIAGFFLAFFSLTERNKGKALTRDSLILAITFASYSMLAVLSVLRTLVSDRASLIAWHHRLYPAVLFMAPFSFYLAFISLGRKYRALLVAGHFMLAVSFFALPVLFSGKAFSAEFRVFSFGIFPESCLIIKTWGALSAICFLLAGLPSIIHAYINGAEKLLLTGLTALYIMTLGNLPSLLGIAFYPTGNFHFIPMFLIALGLNKKAKGSWHDLLLRQHGLFYFLNSILAIILILQAMAFLGSFNVLEIQSRNWFPYALAPLFVMFLLILSGFIVGGIDPELRQNQIISLIMICLGFFMLVKLCATLQLLPLVEHRIRQIGFIPLSLIPALFVRLLLHQYKISAKILRLASDLTAAFFISLSFSPFMFRGYYTLWYGRVPAAAQGMVLLALSLLSISVIAIFFRIKKRRAARNSSDSVLDDKWIFLFTIATCVILAADLLNTITGYFFPYSFFLIIPVLALLPELHRRFSGSHFIGALKLSALVSAVNFGTILFLMILFVAVIIKEGSIKDRFFYVFLGGSPLLLLAFQLTFLFVRPFSKQIDGLNQKLAGERRKSDRLLYNILPMRIAKELKESRDIAPRKHANVSVIFADFVAFSSYSASIDPEILVAQLDHVFQKFESICQKNKIEKLKTIGDAMMCVSGLAGNEDHGINACAAAIEMIASLNARHRLPDPKMLPLQLRIGIHSGPVISGVTGRQKMAFDIWGHTVNIAARMEATSFPDKIHVSERTMQMANSRFVFEEREVVALKNMPSIKTYFLSGPIQQLA